MSYRRVIITEFGGPKVLKSVEENDLPEPAAGEVRVRILAAGVAFTDIMIRKGMYPDVRKKPPFSPGYDMVGIVERRGEGVTGLKEGSMVADMTVTGGYSEYICLPADRLTPVPDSIDPAEAAGVILSYSTAYQMLNRVAEIENKQSILVHGAGGAVGTALLQLGKLQDLQMFGTASPGKQALVFSTGGIPIDYRNKDFVSEIHDLTGTGVDAAFDHIGGRHFRRSFNCVKKKGILVAYGFYNAVTGKGGRIPIDIMKLKLWNLLPNGRSARFYSIGALRKKHPRFFSEDLAEVFRLLEEGKIRPVIDRRMPLSRAAEAQRLLERGEVKGKIVLQVSTR